MNTGTLENSAVQWRHSFLGVKSLLALEQDLDVRDERLGRKRDKTTKAIYCDEPNT